MPTYLTPGVYVEEVDTGSRPIEGVGTAVAAFVGFAATGPFNTATLVSNWTQYTRNFGDFVADYYLPQAVYGYFLNGGGNCYVVRIGGARGESDNGQAGAIGNAPANGASNGNRRKAPAAPQAELGGYRLVAKEPSVADISIEVADPTGENAGDDRFDLVVRSAGAVVETFQALTTKRGKDNVVTAVRERSQVIGMEEVAGAPVRLEKGVVELRQATEPAPAAAAASTPTVAAGDYVGDVAQRTGFGGLEAIDEITMVAVPDLMSAYQRGLINLETVKGVQGEMVAHCELMGDRMAILDPPPDLAPQQIREWRADGGGFDSKYATLYYPWVKVLEPVTGVNTFVPPSGHVAGVWARNDSARGVHKAPANEILRGAIALGTQLTKNEQELLNPIGVNCIRSFPGRGIRVWGARTLSSDPGWRYLNVRRLFNYLEESILDGTQWVVFEPNDDALWARIRRTISAFLITEWRKGALFGLTPDEAFYVKCDRETNPAETIDLGQVVCEVGIAPVKPAEFVIFRLSQMSGGTSLVNE